MRTCVICGNEFEPYFRLRNKQKCCSKECSKEHLRRLSHEYCTTDEHREKARNARRKIAVCYCRICGKKLEKSESISGRMSNIRMHDECIYKDIIKTLNADEMLSQKQKLRLYSRGWTIREFKEEYREELK